MEEEKNREPHSALKNKKKNDDEEVVITGQLIN